MEKRLLLLLHSEDMNPTRFAEKIGVQRSSISHILSGRNKPSYDFLVKILYAFPQLNAEWLLTGKGKMYKTETPGQLTLFDQIPSEMRDKTIGDAQESASKQLINELKDQKSEPGNDDKVEIIEKTVYKSKQEKIGSKIEKIVIFYSDRTFKDYIKGEDESNSEN